ASINGGLKYNFVISFSTSPCCIQGDESEIRSFYIQYLTERYDINEWPFTDIDHDELLKMFTAFTDTLKFKLQYSDLKLLKLSLAVSHIRVSQGYRVENQGVRTSGILNMLNQSSQFFEIFSTAFKGDFNPQDRKS